MKNILKSVIKYTSNLLPYNALNKGDHPPKIVLYHAVEDITPIYISGYKVKTKSEFIKDIDFLCARYEPVSLEEIVSNKENRKLIHFTFDDGLKSCYTNIAPILKEKGIPASFFINPTFVGNEKIYHRFNFEIVRQSIPDLSLEYMSYKKADALQNLAKANNIDLSKLKEQYNPYMNFDELMSLHHDGFLIGAHSMDHPEFYDITFEEQIKQIESSMKWVQSHLNPAIKAFAFPYTDDGMPNELLHKTAENNIVDISLGTAGLKHDMFRTHFQRIPMEPKKLYNAGQILKYEYFYYKLRGLFGKNVVKRKQRD